MPDNPFARAVSDMRLAQTQYLRSRDFDDLRRCKELEQRVDAMLQQILDTSPRFDFSAQPVAQNNQ